MVDTAERTLADIVTTIENGDFYSDYDQSTADLRLLREAIDLQRQLAEARAERDTLREALRPFAVKADEWDYDPPIYDDADSADQGRSATPTIGDFRRARAALASLEERT